MTGKTAQKQGTDKSYGPHTGARAVGIHKNRLKRYV